MSKTYIEQTIDDDLLDDYHFHKKVCSDIREAYDYIKKNPRKRNYINITRDSILRMLPDDEDKVMLWKAVYAELIAYIHLTGGKE